jgi:hypothetical protein
VLSDRSKAGKVGSVRKSEIKASRHGKLGITTGHVSNEKYRRVRMRQNRSFADDGMKIISIGYWNSASRLTGGTPKAIPVAPFIGGGAG